MLKRRGAFPLVAVLLVLAAAASLYFQALPLVHTPLGQHSYRPSQETAIALKAPSFASIHGANGQGPWVIRLTEDTPENRRAILRALAEVQGIYYEGHVKRWETVKYSALELAQAEALMEGQRGVYTTSTYWLDNAVTVRVDLPQHVPALEERLRRAGIPLDAVKFEVPQPKQVAPQTTAQADFRAWLEVPARAGWFRPLTFTLWFENTGQQELSVLARPTHCGNLVWQVVNERGEVVRPQQAGGTCTTEGIVPKPVAPGQRLVLVNAGDWGATWNLKDPLGRRVPAGRYTLQASFDVWEGSTHQQVRLADVPFNVVNGPVFW